MSKKLGILGGMGPLATADLFRKIILLTDAKCDQEHIHILIDNNTSIPDRTSHIVGNGQDPRRQLIESAKRLGNMGTDFLIMPCNTAHYFYEDIIKEIDIPFLNMIEETVNYIQINHPNIEKIGLLATDGTSNSGIYDKYFEGTGIKVVKPNNTNQQHIMEFIYGIKGNKEVTLDGFYETVENMKNEGVEVFILGCTELSSAYEMFKMKGIYVDPLEVISIRAINYAM